MAIRHHLGTSLGYRCDARLQRLWLLYRGQSATHLHEVHLAL